MIHATAGIHDKDQTPIKSCPEPLWYKIDQDSLLMTVFFTPIGKIYLYDLSNVVHGINYVQKTLEHALLPIDSLILQDGILTIRWFPCDIYAPFHTYGNLRDDGNFYMGTYYSYPYFTDPKIERPNPTATIVFPPAETDTEWKDRMGRTLSFCAHQVESALASITPQLYHRSDDAHTGNPTSQDNLRVANVSMHSRLQIGYLWHQVLAADTAEKKTAVEAQVKKVYANMRTPEHVKAFYHSHDTEEWRKLRHASSDDRNNHRRIHIWQDDFTAGDLLLDVNLKNTTNGVVDHLESRAEFHICATTDYKSAASSPNWELITERVY